jgi:predicted metal-dependent TIM-barrel fold hydrolase
MNANHSNANGAEPMTYIDPHAHMISRTTDDYEAMARAGVVAVIEPAFWIGQARTNVGSYRDYLSHILGFERFRASQFGIQHYCCIGLNSKEANNEALAEGVMEILPEFATKEGVVAIGEIGYDEQTALEDKYFRLQLDLARELDLPVMIHTPHRDKKRGASRSMDIILEHKLSPSKVVIDHVNEETVREVTERGFWAAFSIYPHSKMTAERMCAIVCNYGAGQLIVDSACDWGISDPLSVPKTAALLAEQGVAAADIRRVTYGNALSAYGQSGQMSAADWNATSVDQTARYQGNTILRGGQEPKVEPAKS